MVHRVDRQLKGIRHQTTTAVTHGNCDGSGSGLIRSRGKRNRPISATASEHNVSGWQKVRIRSAAGNDQIAGRSFIVTDGKGKRGSGGVFARELIAHICYRGSSIPA